MSPQNLHFGDDVVIKPGATLQARGGLYFGSHIVVAAGVTILTSSHEYDQPDVLPYGTAFRDKPVRIGDFVWIGMNVTVIPGVTIGEGAVIGAGAVVQRDVPRLSVAAGNPATVVKERDSAAFERARAAGWTISDIRGGPEALGFSTASEFDKHLDDLKAVLATHDMIRSSDLVSLGTPPEFCPAVLYHAASRLEGRFVWDEQTSEFVVTKK